MVACFIKSLDSVMPNGTDAFLVGITGVLGNAASSEFTMQFPAVKNGSWSIQLRDAVTSFVQGLYGQNVDLIITPGFDTINA